MIFPRPFPFPWPFDTSLIKRHRLLHHAVHYPFRFVTNALQRRMCKGRIIATLTSVGARNTQLRQPDVDARATRHPIPSRPAMKRLPERPLAIGLFGHLYRGKGFEELTALRAIVEAASHSSGEEYFQALVRNLARVVDAHSPSSRNSRR